MSFELGGPFEDLPEDVLEVLTRNHFATFVRLTFATLNPGVRLHWSPYLDYLCAKLQDLVEGRTKKLIVMMPPRHLKSICANVALSAFFHGRFPGRHIMAVSYGTQLTNEFAGAVRKVMQSDWYQTAFDTRLASARGATSALKTTEGGIRRATSIEGTATGTGADLMIFDDPQKAGEVLSEAIRSATNHAYENTFLSRRNDPMNCPMLCIMQRLHEDDFVGHITRLENDWEIIRFPAIAEEDEEVVFSSALGEHTFRRAEGEPLDQSRVPLEKLEQDRSTYGEAVWASQYQQRPTPAGGGLVKAAWFRRYQDRPLSFDRTLQSWDTASSIQERACYTVCTTWGIAGQDIYLLDVFRKRLQYPELRREVSRLATTWGATEVLIEDASAGMHLLQELGGTKFARARGVKPVKDKVTRMEGQTNLIESGRVFIPEQAHWLAEYLHEMVMFPNGRFDDQVDSTSQALAELNYKPEAHAGLFEFIRQDTARMQGREDPEATLRICPPAGNNLLLADGKEYWASPEGWMDLPKSLAIRMSGVIGWQLLDRPPEWD